MLLLIDIDMNILGNLEFYRQIIGFENDSARYEITFSNLDRPQQRAVQSLAHSRNLEYEYQQDCAKVFRSIVPGLNSSLPYDANQDLMCGVVGPGTWQTSEEVQPQMNTISNLNFQQLYQQLHSEYDHTYLQDALQSTILPTDGEIPTALVLKNIPFAVKKEQIIEMMCEKGLPLPYAFNYHFDNGLFRGLAFAYFTTPEEASVVINTLNQIDLIGKKLRVAYKKMLPFRERDHIEREKRERRRQLQEQHLPMNITASNKWGIHDFTHDGNVPKRGTTLPENGFDTFIHPQSSRRYSGSSFAVSSAGALADMPSYEDLSAAFAYDHQKNSRSNSLMSFVQYSPIASPGMVPMDPSNTMRTQNRKAASRSGSVNSLQSERGQNRVTKSFGRSSIMSRYSSGIGESMFVSRQDCSSRRSSSGASGRTGPLDYLALMGMKAVKAVGGACWRCRILGKKVSLHEYLCPDENG